MEAVDRQTEVKVLFFLTGWLALITWVSHGSVVKLDADFMLVWEQWAHSSFVQRH